MASSDESKRGECCPPGSLPALVLDKSREKLSGSVKKLESGLAVYQVAPPSESKKAVIVIYDVHGFSGGRIKGVCDTIAAAGFHVVMPDVYGDEAGINDHGGFASDSGKAWLKQFSWERLRPQIEQVQSEVLAPLGVEATGAIGFCWGAYVVFKMSANKMIQATASCHPSLGIGPLLFDDPIADQAAAVTTPVCLCPAGNDRDTVKSGGEVDEVLKKKGITATFKEFPDMKHGWVPRGDTTDAAVARDVRAALETVNAFFKKHL